MVFGSFDSGYGFVFDGGAKGDVGSCLGCKAASRYAHPMHTLEQDVTDMLRTARMRRQVRVCRQNAVADLAYRNGEDTDE